MTSVQMRDVPATSRSLPPVPLLDRGRAKTRINTDPDAYANLRTPSGAVSVSLPPIRPSVRGSKDECSLPGISSIIDQSELSYEHTRPARRLSESSPRGFPASPRDWDSRVHSPPLWTPRHTRVDSINLDNSRPSSPDMSSSTSSLSSIIEDRSACASPGPIPRFALGSRLPPLGSAFELSDLRTSLPSDEPRRSVGPSRTPVVRSPRSTPLPLSRPMSPALQLSPHIRPLTHRLRSLAVTVEEDRVMDNRFTDSPPREEENETRTSTPEVKSEPESDSVPPSPRDKGLSETDLVSHDEVLARSLIDEQVPSEQRDEQMACTPTQPDPKLPLPWMDTEPSTPTNRHSPLVRSPSVESSTKDEDSKSAIIKHSESETEEEEEDMSYEEHCKNRSAAQLEPTSVRTRGRGGGGQYDFTFPPGFSAMPPPIPIPVHPEIAHLAQEAERLGYKLSVDSNRQPATTQSQLLMQMAERQHRIESLQREQAAASMQMSTWMGSISAHQSQPQPFVGDRAFVGVAGDRQFAGAGDRQFGGIPVPEYAPPPLPLSLSPTPQMHPPPIPPSISPQAAPPTLPSNMFLPEDLPPALDYSYPAYTDLPTPTALTDPYSSLSSLSPPSLSATSASSPSDYSWPSPPSLPTYAMPPTTRSSFKAQDGVPEDDILKGLLQGTTVGLAPSGSGSGSGTHKCQSCGKTFRRPSGLKDHMNIHSGEKPYCCPLETCRKGFATRSNMIRHHNKTHPNRPKIGGVADIGTEGEEVPEVDPTEQGSSSQGRFRVVQQSAAGGKESAAGVGPVRGAKERRTMRKQAVG